MEIVFKHLQPGVVIETIVYMTIGIIFFGITIWIIAKVSPFSVRKEIEEDQNVALAIVIGSIIIGVALILSAVMTS